MENPERGKLDEILRVMVTLYISKELVIRHVVKILGKKKTETANFQALLICNKCKPLKEKNLPYQ